VQLEHVLGVDDGGAGVEDERARAQSHNGLLIFLLVLSLSISCAVAFMCRYMQMSQHNSGNPEQQIHGDNLSGVAQVVV
jgi:hypothetical protein